MQKFVHKNICALRLARSVHTKFTTMLFLTRPQVLQRLRHTHLMLVHISACEIAKNGTYKSCVVRDSRGFHKSEVSQKLVPYGKRVHFDQQSIP